MTKIIADSLYADLPDSSLYHYTTIAGLRGIVSSGLLWASDVRYMNDAAELNHIVDLIKQCSDRYPEHKDILKKFISWISGRINSGHMVFVVSFRANGNLLSQWRGYSDVGKGISIGFKCEDIVLFARRNNFKLGRCIYDISRQKSLIHKLLQELITLLNDNSENIVNIFDQVESDILQIAALLKHPSFEEEEEWRLVSEMVVDYLSAPVSFREGKSMIIPYYEFLLKEHGESIPLQHVFVGPTPNSQLSLNSVRFYLKKNNIFLKEDVSYCNIPYRGR